MSTSAPAPAPNPPSSASLCSTLPTPPSAGLPSPNPAARPAPAAAPVPAPQSGPSSAPAPAPASDAALSPSNPNGYRKCGSSESIRAHADAVMQLIHEQRALAVRSATAEITLLHAELGKVRGELKTMKKKIEEKDHAESMLNDVWKRQGAMLKELERENGEMRKRLENGEMRKRLESGVENGMDVDSEEKEKQMGAEADVLRKRCEELERENERLRKNEANLRQRVEIFESLNASASAALHSVENLPDLNGALETLKGHLVDNVSSSSTVIGQDEVHAKKRRLEELNSG